MPIYKIYLDFVVRAGFETYQSEFKQLIEDTCPAGTNSHCRFFPAESRLIYIDKYARMQFEVSNIITHLKKKTQEKIYKDYVFALGPDQKSQHDWNNDVPAICKYLIGRGNDIVATKNSKIWKICCIRTGFVFASFEDNYITIAIGSTHMPIYDLVLLVEDIHEHRQVELAKRSMFDIIYECRPKWVKTPEAVNLIRDYDGDEEYQSDNDITSIFTVEFVKLAFESVKTLLSDSEYKFLMDHAAAVVTDVTNRKKDSDINLIIPQSIRKISETIFNKWWYGLNIVDIIIQKMIANGMVGLKPFDLNLRDIDRCDLSRKD